MRLVNISVSRSYATLDELGSNRVLPNGTTLVPGGSIANLTTGRGRRL